MCGVNSPGGGVAQSRIQRIIFICPTDSPALTENGNSYPTALYYEHHASDVFPHRVPGVARLKYGASASHVFLCHRSLLFVFATRRSRMVTASVMIHLFFCFVLLSFLCVTRVEAQVDARCPPGWEWVRNRGGRIECCN